MGPIFLTCVSPAVYKLAAVSSMTASCSGAPHDDLSTIIPTCDLRVVSRPCNGNIVALPDSFPQLAPILLVPRLHTCSSTVLYSLFCIFLFSVGSLFARLSFSSVMFSVLVRLLFISSAVYCIVNAKVLISSGCI